MKEDREGRLVEVNMMHDDHAHHDEHDDGYHDHHDDGRPMFINDYNNQVRRDGRGRRDPGWQYPHTNTIPTSEKYPQRGYSDVNR